MQGRSLRARQHGDLDRLHSVCVPCVSCAPSFLSAATRGLHEGMLLAVQL